MQAAIDALFTSQNGRFFISLFLAIVSGYLVGAEKELRGKDAGIRTHTFVIVGSMIFTFISSIISEDKARLAANIITGVGFLGAGLIMKGNSGHVHNLTTAASVWYSAAIGMLYGFGFFVLGIVATVFGIYISWLPGMGKRPKIRRYYETSTPINEPLPSEEELMDK